MITAKEIYAADGRRRPLYHDGTPRKRWDQLGALEQSTWAPQCHDFTTELTEQGEQLVIPGCERPQQTQERPQGDLFSYTEEAR